MVSNMHKKCLQRTRTGLSQIFYCWEEPGTEWEYSSVRQEREVTACSTAAQIPDHNGELPLNRALHSDIVFCCVNILQLTY